ncbi:AAA family ATPase [Zhouia amylolytica]|uniref:Uncharacterized protein n=1 Tax=Zhouia amylolytica AD3 TaxID=1286632 RepID=W2URT8_9FLAO|nr:AAA family ATPase [Zhouia amylolytica]ETN96870.1 hypothetical protein P278_02960 [Zhouia amylolytica AD3]
MNENQQIEEVKTLETEVKAFVNAQPYWAKYLCSEILAGNDITESVIDNAYSYLLENLSFKQETEKPELFISYNPNASDDYKENLSFDSLTNVEGVNALTENQTIDLAHNLTIIYGTNGAGKSGYVRLLKNVFYSKDKEDILPNINIDSGHKPKAATFNFSSEGTNIPLKYPDNIGNGIFNQFAVFDGDIGKKHLSLRNDFSFRPAGLQLFNEFNVALERLNGKLSIEIQSKSIANPFADDDIFQGESEIKTWLIQLSHNSKLEELNAHLPYSEEEKTKKVQIDKEYDDLKIALAQKDKALKELQTIKAQLAARIQNLVNTNTWFAQDQLNRVIKAITNCKTKEDTAQKEGVEKFKTDKIENIGSTEWKQFIEAAAKFASTQNEGEYPSLGDNCILCQQAINDDVPKSLISSYWAYIKSVAEQEAKTAKENLAKLKADYEKLSFDQFPETDTLAVWLKDKHETVLANLKDELKKQETLRQTLVSNITDKKDNLQVEIQIDLSALFTISETVDKEIKAFEEDEQNKKLGELLKKKTYLAHKEKLEARYPDIETLHKNLIWVNKANQFNKRAVKKSSTDTEKRLSEKYFNTDYISEFNNECDKLNGKFGIEIDARSSDARSNRQLFLKGNDPSAILSEGEQKVIALADFIAETNITTINRGIILDDPVNSLDHERKETIAKRLVEISGSKQVIVFTHDVVFFKNLEKFGLRLFGKNSPSIKFNTIRATGRNAIGTVISDHSPVRDSLYTNPHLPKTYLQKAKRETDEDFSLSLIRSGFGALRSCYEAITATKVLASAVQRFDSLIRVSNIRSIKYDLPLYDRIIERHSFLHDLIEGHLPAEELNISFTTDKLENEITEFENILTELDNI